MNKRIEAVGYFPIAHNHQSYGANAGPFVVGCLEINGCKVFHYNCKYNEFRGNMQADRPPSLFIYFLVFVDMRAF